MSKKSAYLMALLALLIGFGAGIAAGKGCPPVPVPAAAPHDGSAKPVSPAAEPVDPAQPVAAPVGK